MSRPKHGFAGRLLGAGPAAEAACATFCTCGLAFYHRGGLAASDLLWERHRDESE